MKRGHCAHYTDDSLLQKLPAELFDSVMCQVMHPFALDQLAQLRGVCRATDQWCLSQLATFKNVSCCVPSFFVENARHLPALQTLSLCVDDLPSDAVVAALCSITSLRTLAVPFIAWHQLEWLSQLRHLQFTDRAGFSCLRLVAVPEQITKVTALAVWYNFELLPRRLNSLKKLVLERAHTFQSGQIALMSHLQSLTLNHLTLPIGERLYTLTALHSLSLGFTGECRLREDLPRMTWLSKLKLRETWLSDETVVQMTALHSLKLRKNARLTVQCLRTLTQLTRLALRQQDGIVASDLGHLTRLQCLLVNKQQLR